MSLKPPTTKTDAILVEFLQAVYQDTSAYWVDSLPKGKSLEALSTFRGDLHEATGRLSEHMQWTGYVKHKTWMVGNEEWFEGTKHLDHLIDSVFQSTSRFQKGQHAARLCCTFRDDIDNFDAFTHGYVLKRKLLALKNVLDDAPGE